MLSHSILVDNHLKCIYSVEIPLTYSNRTVKYFNVVFKYYTNEKTDIPLSVTKGATMPNELKLGTNDQLI